jgi:hypothetical protein
MFTTGSKLLVGSALAATVAAVIYGLTIDGSMGTIGLVAAAIALAFLAGVNAYVRDANVLETDDASVAASAAARRAPGKSLWPLGFAAGASLVAVGLVTQQTYTVIGFVLVGAAGAEWMVQAWAESTSSDPAYNEDVRERVMQPLEFPILGVAVIGILVYAFSRLMLALSKEGTVILFAVVAAIILAIAAIIALRPSVRTGTIGAVLAVGAILVIGSGVAAGIDGPRQIQEHETVDELSTEGICESPEEFEADENASQTISDTQGIGADITLESDGTLTFDVPGPQAEGATALTLPRSNTTNIAFHNESDHERRLSLDLGTEIVETEDGEEEEVPNQTCTTLVEDGGSQLLTVRVDLPSATAPDGYFFFVPGVETAMLELVVP